VTLECVVNVSEGTDQEIVAAIGAAAGPWLLDAHSDVHHNRSVFTLAAIDTETLTRATKALAAAAIEQVDLTRHRGVHPRLGVVDVVPFAPIGRPPFDLGEAIAARATFAQFAADQLRLPCFIYGPERTLPEVRRHAFRELMPDLGPPVADPARGACCVGAREPLVAYNIVLEQADLGLARRIAEALRGPGVRALGLPIGDEVQVSCNLVAPFVIGPAELVDACRKLAPINRTELVGLVPAGVLGNVARERWKELDLSEDSTVEGRLGGRG
jgi:glutamate formiminotransferase / 5-formyltetrahydrofolate cyclo-ligase